MADWPTLKEVRTMLRMQPNPDEDALIDRARTAAKANIIRRCGHRFDETGPVPDDVHFAALLQAARWYRRRDSLDGTIGFGDIGVVRIGKLDPDIEAMLPVTVVFG